MKRNPKVQVLEVRQGADLLLYDPILLNIRKEMYKKLGKDMGYEYYEGKIRINRKVYGFNGHARDEMEMLTKGTKEAVRWYRTEHGMNRYDCRK